MYAKNKIRLATSVALSLSLLLGSQVFAQERSFFADAVNESSAAYQQQSQFFDRQQLQSNDQNAQNRFSVSKDTYIIQDGDDLWLVMGSLKAKISILLYADENQRNEMERNGQSALIIPFIDR